jgi:two-component sensor histidine kinase/sensor domain CHASE-containing protein
MDSQRHLKNGFLFLAILAGVSSSLGIAGTLLLSFSSREQREQERETVRAEAKAIALQLEPAYSAAFASSLLTASTDTEDFNSLATKYIQQLPIIRSIALAPQGIVSQMFPPRENGLAIGISLFRDRQDQYDAFQNNGRSKLSVFLTSIGKEGETYLTVRYPIYEDDAFWGFSAATLSLESLIDNSSLRLLESRGQAWSLSMKQPNGTEDRPFAHSAIGLPKLGIPEEIVLPNGTWVLRVEPANERRSMEALIAIVSIYVLLSLLITALATSYVNKRRRLAHTAKELAAEVAIRRKTEEQLSVSLKEKELLLREIHHRVKNNLAVVESIISLQSMDAAGTKFEPAFDQLAKRIHSISLIHEKLYRGHDLNRVAVRAYCLDLVGYIHDTLCQDAAPPETDIDDFELSQKAAVPLGLMITELCTNAIKYGEKGSVRASIKLRNGMVVVTMENQGAPLREDYRERSGLGLKLIDALATQLGGTERAESGETTRFIVEFPHTL